LPWSDTAELLTFLPLPAKDYQAGVVGLLVATVVFHFSVHLRDGPAMTAKKFLS
jgi:hypothetical protein